MVVDVSAVAGWQLVSLRVMRSRIVPRRKGDRDGAWASVAEWRARMLAA